MNSEEKDLNYYLNLPWTPRIEWDPRDNIYVARIAELKGCMSHGKTFEEAANNLQEALSLYLETALEENIEIQEPAKPEDYKGTIPYRTTPERHYKLAQKSKAEGKSINKIIDEAIEKELKSA